MLINFVEKFILRHKAKRPVSEALLIDLAAILLWRGVWGLLDLYLFPERPEMSFVFSILVAVVLMISLRIRK